MRLSDHNSIATPSRAHMYKHKPKRSLQPKFWRCYTQKVFHIYIYIYSPVNLNFGISPKKQFVFVPHKYNV